MNWYFSMTLAQAESAPAPPSNTAPPATAPVQTTTTTTDGKPAPDGTDTSQKKPGNPLVEMLPMIVLFLVIFYLLIILPQRRDKKRHQNLVANLSKGDKIVTNSGILGTIVEVRPNEIVVKVDESANTRMRFLPDAVRAVLNDKNE